MGEKIGMILEVMRGREDNMILEVMRGREDNMILEDEFQGVFSISMLLFLPCRFNTLTKNEQDK